MKLIATFLTLLLTTILAIGQSSNLTATKIRAEESLRVGNTSSQKVTGFDLTMPGSPTHGKLPTTKCIYDWITGNYMLIGATAGGDLSGTYPNPTVDALQGYAISATTPIMGQVLEWSGSQWVPATDDTGLTSVNTTATLSGAGTSGSPLTIAQQSATSGQVLKWNGSAWTPAADNNTGTTYTAGSGISINGSNVISNTSPADNLGNHTATTTLNLSNNGVINASTITKVGSISTGLINMLSSGNMDISTTNSSTGRYSAFNLKDTDLKFRSVIDVTHFNLFEVNTAGFSANFLQDDINGQFGLDPSGLLIASANTTAGTQDLVQSGELYGFNVESSKPSGHFSIETKDAGTGDVKLDLQTIFSVNDHSNLLKFRLDSTQIQVGNQTKPTYMAIGPTSLTIGNEAIGGDNYVKYQALDPNNYLKYTVDKSDDIAADPLAIPDVGTVKKIAIPMDAGFTDLVAYGGNLQWRTDAGVGDAGLRWDKSIDDVTGGVNANHGGYCWYSDDGNGILNIFQVVPGQVFEFGTTVVGQGNAKIESSPNGINITANDFVNGNARTLFFEVAQGTSNVVLQNSNGGYDFQSVSGGILPPRLTETQRDALTPIEGLTIYNTDAHKLQVYDGTTWQNAW